MVGRDNIQQREFLKIYFVFPSSTPVTEREEEREERRIRNGNECLMMPLIHETEYFIVPRLIRFSLYFILIDLIIK